MNKLTAKELESKLWEAADILRGTVDSGDYKNYIFTLLALKRLNDTFEEEVQKFIADGYNEEFARDPDNHAFYLPKETLWEEIPEMKDQNGQTYSLGEAINKACATIERHPHNTERLQGVLTIADFNDSHKLGGARHKQNLLERLYTHFSTLHLADGNLADPDILGRAYEYLIKHFAEGAGKKGGEFFTPPEVVQLMVEIAKPQPHDRVLDPTAGSGGFLIRSARYVREHAMGKTDLKNGAADTHLALYGQEINGSTWGICKLNMLLHGHGGAVIKRGDSIREPLLVDEQGGLIQADLVLANPPFSLKKWGHEAWESDAHGRNVYGTPPKTKGDWAFIQHMLAHCDDEGRVLTVIPHGVLFRGATEGKIRRKILENDLVEAVLGLGSNIFYGTSIPAAILVLNKDKTKDREGKVLFINAAETYREGRAQNYLDREHIERIRDAYAAYQDEELFARVVSLDEIKENDWNLNITRYVDATPPPEPIDVKQALAELRELERKRDEAEVRMNELLAEMGYQ